MRVGRLLVSCALLGAPASCRDDAPSPAPAISAEPPPRPAAAAPAPGRVEIVAVPEGAEDAAVVVRRELDRAQADRRDLIVYVGAPWCEPCTRFHKAAQAGELDAAFPSLRLVEFDHDRDEARLQAAGYTSRLIPLFAVPGPDGRASGKQIEGSIKGDGAVAQIAPRLQALLAEARR